MPFSCKALVEIVTLDLHFHFRGIQTFEGHVLENR